MFSKLNITEIAVKNGFVNASLHRDVFDIDPGILVRFFSVKC